MSFFLAALLLLVPGLALAQSGQVVPAGQFTPGHTVRCQNSTCTVVVDGGGSGGATVNGQGYLTEIGITNTGTPFCISDALISDPGGYHQFCIGANALGGGLISYNAYGGAADLGFTFNLNGVNYPFPPAGTGNVVGPTSPLPTAGDLVLWNGGTTVKDGGLAPISVYAGQSIQDALTVAGAAGGATVILRAPAAFTLTQPLIMSSGTRLSCEKGVTITATSAGWSGDKVHIENINYGNPAVLTTPITDHDLSVSDCTFLTAGTYHGDGTFHSIAFRKAAHIQIYRNIFMGGGNATALVADDDTHTDENSMGTVTTGNTHTSTLLDGLNSTANVTQGATVFGPGIQAGTTVATINSSTSVTLSLAATATATGVRIIFDGAANACYDHWEAPKHAFVHHNKCGTSIYGILFTGTDTTADSAQLGANAQIDHNEIAIGGTSSQAGIWLNGLFAGAGVSRVSVDSNTITGDGASNFTCIKNSDLNADNTIQYNKCYNSGTNSQGIVSVPDVGGTPVRTIIAGNILDGIQVQSGNVAAITLAGTGDRADGNTISGGNYPSCIRLAADQNRALNNVCQDGTTGNAGRYETASATNQIIVDVDTDTPGPVFLAGTARVHQLGATFGIEDTNASIGSASPRLLLRALNTTPAYHTYAAIGATPISATPGAEAGNLNFYSVGGAGVMNLGGSLNNQLHWLLDTPSDCGSFICMGDSGVNIGVGLQVAAPTGGDKPAAVNARSGFYENGVKLNTVLTGTTASMGGSLLAAGVCASTANATVSGATTSMAVAVSPAGGVDPGAGIGFNAWVSSANTVTVRICNTTTAGVTPAATTYNVRVLQ